MTGNPKAAWMRQALAIKDDNIWSNLELGKDLQQGWGFTEGQQAGNVGEVDRTLDALTLDDGQGRVVQHNDSSVYGKCSRSDRYICPSDVAYITYIRAYLDMAPQTLLDALGFSDTDAPGMEFAILHRWILSIPASALDPTSALC